MSDYINPAGHEDWLNPDNWGLDDADWAAMQEHAAAQTRANLVQYTGYMMQGDIDWTTLIGWYNTIAPAMGHNDHGAGELDTQAANPNATSSNTFTEPASPNTLSGNGVPGPLHRSSEDRRLRCSHASCTHQGTFRRHYELERHIRVKHEGKKPYSCPFPGCYKDTTPPSYIRVDKLTSHIRNAHAKHTNKLLNCYFPDCAQRSLPIDLLGVHIWHAHAAVARRSDYITHRIQDEGARGMWNAASTAYRQCPLWRCGASMPLRSFIQHLQSHTAEELDEAVELLSSDGYKISFVAAHHLQQNVEDLPSGSCRSVVIQVHCPLCGKAHDTHETLQMHLDNEHLVTQDHQEHFQIWKSHAINSKKFDRKCKFHPWESWRLDKLWMAKCFHCDFGTKRASYEESFHQKSMLVDPVEIMPYRRAILKLYPDFATHPIWKDLA